MTIYQVTIRYQHPAWNVQDGVTYEVNAVSKRDAISQVRRIAERDGNAGRGLMLGRQTFTARAAQ